MSWKARVTRTEQGQVYGNDNFTEFRINSSSLPLSLKKGDVVEGYLAGGAIIPEKVCRDAVYIYSKEESLCVD